MKIIPLIFATAIICQSDTRADDSLMLTHQWKTQNLSNQRLNISDCTDPPCKPQTNPLKPLMNYQQPNRFSHDCLLCFYRPCPNCPKAQLYSVEQCSPCTSPPCPPCPGTLQNSFSRLRSFEIATHLESHSPDCPFEEVEAKTEELVHKIAAILPIVCFLRRSSLLPFYRPVDISCLFRGAGIFGFIRQHLPQLTEYLQRHSLISEEVSEPLLFQKDEHDNAVVNPHPGKTPRQPLLQTPTNFPSFRSSKSTFKLQQEVEASRNEKSAVV